jgi:uncharacterized FlgJ-related protein
LLRQIRAYKRQHNLKLTGVSLSEGLEKYSEIGYEYIELVQSGPHHHHHLIEN